MTMADNAYMPTIMELRLYPDKGLPNKDAYAHLQRGASCESAERTGVCCRRGNNWPGETGEIQCEHVLVPTACAAHTNWVPLLGLKVMKLPLS